MKACLKCGVKKSLDSFYSDVVREDKKSPYCKDCHRERKRLAKLANPEKISAQKHASYLRHVDTKKRYDKLYHVAHKEKKNAQSKVWKNNNKDKYNQRCNMLHRRHRENLEDEYIKTLLMGSAIAMKRGDIPQELIEIKRLTILIKRRVKDENKTM